MTNQDAVASAAADAADLSTRIHLLFTLYALMHNSSQK